MALTHRPSVPVHSYSASSNRIAEAATSSVSRLPRESAAVAEIRASVRSAGGGERGTIEVKRETDGEGKRAPEFCLRAAVTDHAVLHSQTAISLGALKTPVNSGIRGGEEGGSTTR